MSGWELRRVAVVVGAIALVGLTVAQVGSALVGEWSRGVVTLWLVLIALPMLLVAGGHFGNVPFGAAQEQRSQWSEFMLGDHLARRVEANHQEEISRQLQVSWTTAIALAGVVLLVVAGVVTMA